MNTLVNERVFHGLGLDLKGQKLYRSRSLPVAAGWNWEVDLDRLRLRGQRTADDRGELSDLDVKLELLGVELHPVDASPDGSLPLVECRARQRSPEASYESHCLVDQVLSLLVGHGEESERFLLLLDVFSLGREFVEPMINQLAIGLGYVVEQVAGDLLDLLETFLDRPLLLLDAFAIALKPKS